MHDVGGGHDKINARIFKATYLSIIDEIVHLMNICLQTNTFPRLLKRAVVKPIYKIGDKQKFNNYRPISLLPVISKLLERLIYARLNEHLTANNILNGNQFGFRKGMSTYMPLILMQEKITKALEEGRIVCGLFLDLRKAFDTVNIEVLLNKIDHYGIRKGAHDMLRSYLAERTQCVEVDQVRSSFQPVNTGVPQGSILGPLLFILYINDFPAISDSMDAYLYADDTAIFVEGNTAGEVQKVINELMPKVTDWFIANQLSVNTDKTYYQVYSNKKVPTNILFHLGGANIKRAYTVKYLGVFIDENMKWGTHIDKLYRTLCRNVGMISKAKYFLSSDHLLLLYNSLFLAHVNYCCFIFTSTYPTHISKLEKIQKRAVRLVDGQSRLAHSGPIFKKLKLLKVQDIGKQQMLLLLHRKLQNGLPQPIDRLFSSARPSRSFRNIKHFVEPYSSKLYGQHIVSWVAPRVWNSIMVTMFPLVQTVPSSKYAIKKITKKYFINQY